jgi:hypothetical protein
MLLIERQGLIVDIITVAPDRFGDHCVKRMHSLASLGYSRHRVSDVDAPLDPAGLQNPIPTTARQRIFNPSGGNAWRMHVSLHTPSRFGPRHCGQSPARTSTASVYGRSRTTIGAPGRRENSLIAAFSAASRLWARFQGRTPFSRRFGNREIIRGKLLDDGDTLRYSPAAFFLSSAWSPALGPIGRKIRIWRRLQSRIGSLLTP